MSGLFDLYKDEDEAIADPMSAEPTYSQGEVRTKVNKDGSVTETIIEPVTSAEAPAAAKPVTSSTSQESCASCQAQSSAVVQPAATPESSANNPGADEFTYDEGKGEKELIQITGPLSEVFTKALNVYYAKEPILTEKNIPENISQSDTALLAESSKIDQHSNESMINTETNLNAILDYIVAQDPGSTIGDSYDFTTDSNMKDMDDPDMIVKSMEIEEALEPETVSKVEDAANAGKSEMVLVISNKPYYSSATANDVKLEYVNIAQQYASPYVTSEDEVALEKLYTHPKIKTVLGVPELFSYLKERKAKA